MKLDILKDNKNIIFIVCEKNYINLIKLLNKYRYYFNNKKYFNPFKERNLQINKEIYVFLTRNSKNLLYLTDNDTDRKILKSFYSEKSYIINFKKCLRINKIKRLNENK